MKSLNSTCDFNRVVTPDRNKSRFFQPKLSINQPNDIYEQEADAVADKVMRMADNETPGNRFFKPAITPVQRKCEHCEEKEKRMQQKGMNGEEAIADNSLEYYVGGLSSGGQPLPHEVRNFYEPRLGFDFSNVKVHTDTVAAKSAQSINALAYTSGNNIVFNNGQYAPGTESGKRLLGHELTHVIQQQPNTIQRAVHRGQDHAGSYEFDDSACTLQYNQDWYFSFPSEMLDTAKNAYMARAENQVENAWSHQFPLVPFSGSCPCTRPGVEVAVNINSFNESRGDRHGYSVSVVNEWSGVTNQPARSMSLSVTQDVPEYKGGGLSQPVIAHEFGHTLGITDEYSGWAAFWNAIGYNDRSSMMHTGDQVRPRHYQHFADLISNAIEGCLYHPREYSSLSLANPVAQAGVTGALSLDNADFILELGVDRRVGNSDFLGLFTPRVGYSALLNTANGNIMTGPTVSLNLNRIAHPIYVDVGTGLFYDPADPGRPAALNLSPSATVGLRGNGFSAGVNYTGMIDLLGNNGYTHMVGLNLQFDLPGGR